MSNVAELEQQILALSTEDFLHLRDVVYERERVLLGVDEYEDDPDLEAALLKGLEGPRIPVNAAFFDSIRQGWNKRAS